MPEDTPVWVIPGVGLAVRDPSEPAAGECERWIHAHGKYVGRESSFRKIEGAELREFALARLRESLSRLSAEHVDRLLKFLRTYVAPEDGGMAPFHREVERYERVDAGHGYYRLRRDMSEVNEGGPPAEDLRRFFIRKADDGRWVNVTGETPIGAANVYLAVYASFHEPGVLDTLQVGQSAQADFSLSGEKRTYDVLRWNDAVPKDVWNVNTVQDACWRLREACERHGISSPQAERRRRQLDEWIAHARATT